MSKKTGLIIFVCLLCIVVSGCGQKSYVENKVEKELEKNLGENVNVNVGDNEVKIETEEGAYLQAGEDVSLPEDFPSDVYVADGQIVSAMKDVMGEGYQAVIRAGQSVKALKGIYEEKLPKQGWEITQSFEVNDAVMISAKKGKRTIQITIGSEEGEEGTALVINVK